MIVVTFVVRSQQTLAMGNKPLPKRLELQTRSLWLPVTALRHGAHKVWNCKQERNRAVACTALATTQANRPTMRTALVMVCIFVFLLCVKIRSKLGTTT